MSEELRSLPVAKKYYGQVAEIYDQSRQGKEEFHQDQFVIENIVRALVQPGSQVLDIACGTNRISKFVRDLGGVYHGIDISSEMVAFARKKEPGSDIRVADARNIPHPPGKFDLVIAVKFLKWLPEDGVVDQVLHEVARVMRPGGLALLHQKIQVAPEVDLRNGLRAAIAKSIKRKLSRRKPDVNKIKTRAIDEALFLDLCGQVGLTAKYVLTTLPIATAAAKRRVDAFYVMQKQE